MSVQRKTTAAGQVRWLARWPGRGSRTFDRRADAERWEAEARRAAQLGAHAPAEASRETLAEWLETWWDREAPTWRKTTRLNRAAVLDKWVSPYLGTVRLFDLGHDRVAAWHADIARDGASAHQRDAAARILSASLSSAVRARRLPANPVAGLRRQPVGVTRPRALTPEEVERIRAAMPTPRDAAIVSVMAYAGLRPEEVWPLTWRDVGRTLHVWRTFAQAGELVDLTKTGRGRSVEVIAPLAADLAALRPTEATDDDLVFPAARGGMLHLLNWRARVWGPACEAAGVSARPYDLRHTYCSLLIWEGRPLPYVSASMGHSSARMTLDRYAHVFEEARLAPNVPMADAVQAARKALAGSELHSRCTRGVRGHLRLVS